MGHFRVKSVKKLEDLKEGDVINESDYSTITMDNKFLQLEYVEEDQKLSPYPCKPGIWAIKKTLEGLKLYETSFNGDKVLESFINTKDVTDKIDCFFRKLHVYTDLGFDVAKRAALLWGPAGTGKSTAISLISKKYAADNETAIVIWHTDKIESFQVKDFIKSFEYVGVKKLILIAEDIGGFEKEQSRHHSDSSLLSLLDNQEKTFNIPVFILATTNYPENFMGNLTNRPNRFDDKIEFGFPEAKYRRELLKFFLKRDLDEKEVELIESSVTKEFSPAHIREAVIRSLLHDKSIEAAIREISKEIEIYNQGFSKKGRMGFDQ